MKFVLKLALGGLSTHVAGFVLLFLLAFSFSQSEILPIVAESLFILGIISMFLALFLWFGIYLARMNPKPGELLVLGSGFVLGFLTWSLSETISGHPEPWNAESPYYVVAMLGSGLLCGALAPRMWLMSGFSIFFGQLIPSGFGLGMFGTIGTISLVVGSVPAFLGAALASYLVKQLANHSHQSGSD